ncbi:protealysin inhibitor emfourin [Xanthomonas sp. BRIP62409]|uniref:protealysin inhibitor emfourin n=1 Tax=Xanthomonas sp. BRIP62409 TaxID=2182388 RepID=UPI000F8D7430|nr:protealysin inhibitor emfourin [Xanthomonas sp. BRIP62409]
MSAQRPPVEAGVILRLAREGGVAAFPAMRRERQLVMDDLDDAQRLQLRSVLDQCLAHALPRPQAGGGDRRYFSIAWDGASEPLRIPEEHAPAAIVRLWKQGTL